MDVDSYLATVRERLGHAGFVLGEPGGGAALEARRRQFKLTRFGLVETVVGVSSLRADATPNDLRTFGADVYRSALAGKSRLPRGLGSSVVTYPVLLADRVSPELREFAGGYAPKHWCVLEFPIVVDASSGSLVHLDKTPLWGAAYYRRTRAEGRELFSP